MMDDFPSNHVPLPEPVPVTEQVWPEGTVPLVCTRTMAYMHEDYIAECIEGLIMQRTTFPVRYIIHDDASTDRTADIIRGYAERYPQIIKVVCQQENSWGKVDRRERMALVRDLIQGKYLALCEGDDYWTDPLKLEKQVRFLESHPDYSLTYHDASIVDTNGELLEKSKIPAGMARDFSADELCRNETFILTLTMVYRRIPGISVAAPYEALTALNADNFLTSRLGLHGKGKYMADIQPAVYRKHGGGVWSPLSQAKRDQAQLNSYLWMGAYYNRIGRPDLAEYFFARVKKRTEPMAEWYELRNRKIYQLFARVMGWFKVTLPR